MKTGDEFIVEVTYVEVFGWFIHLHVSKLFQNCSLSESFRTGEGWKGYEGMAIYGIYGAFRPVRPPFSPGVAPVRRGSAGPSQVTRSRSSLARSIRRTIFCTEFLYICTSVHSIITRISKQAIGRETSDTEWYIVIRDIGSIGNVIGVSFSEVLHPEHPRADLLVLLQLDRTTLHHQSAVFRLRQWATCLPPMFAMGQDDSRCANNCQYPT